MTSAPHQSQNPPQFIVVTDLDGTLLDQRTYRYDDCLPTIQRLGSLGIPLILCSSKTRAEIHPLWNELDLGDPFIVENGGAVYIPEQSFPFPVDGAKVRGKFRILEFGSKILILRKVLAKTAQELGVKIRCFGSMTPMEIASLTGLNKDDAVLAAKREYDEPFVIEVGEGEILYRALTAKGFNVVKGDRFYHVTGGNDKGRAVAALLELYRRSNPSIISVGLGNSANDIGLLSKVDRPILVRNPDGAWDSEVMEKIPTILRSNGIGPQGWREAIEHVLISFGL